MGSSITVSIHPHWFSAWFLYLAAKPVLQIDGVEQRAQWNSACTVALRSGAHKVSVGLRYRGSSSLLGSSTLKVGLRDNEPKAFVARNGWANHTPFIITEA
ncbi:hypothetical protein [Arthrobacter sp. MYb227]|uniref:hypothetical protein n=1 Tax=Arthrobacter sp. MYb227 TaxID=1848601 RepID=UPI0015E37B46|nr:hypothetical protein [Arthrobacter sp. MYb227]